MNTQTRLNKLLPNGKEIRSHVNGILPPHVAATFGKFTSISTFF